MRPNDHGLVTTGPGDIVRPGWGVPGSRIIVEYKNRDVVASADFFNWESGKPGTLWDTSTPDPVLSSRRTCSWYNYNGTLADFKGSGPGGGRPVVHVPPALFYHQAPELYTSGQLRAGKWVPGQPLDPKLDNDGMEWALSNGIVRIGGWLGKLTETSDLVTSFFNDGVWDSETTWRLERKNNTSYTITPDWESIEVLENTATRVTVRLMSRIWTDARMLFLDITLYRGRPIIYLSLYTHSLISLSGPGIRFTCSEAGSVVTGFGSAGIERASADAGGNKWVVAASGVSYGDGGTGSSVTFDTTLGGVLWEYTSPVGDTQVRVSDIGIMYEPNGAIDQFGETAEHLLAQYYAPVAESVQPVLR